MENDGSIKKRIVGIGVLFICLVVIMIGFFIRFKEMGYLKLFGMFSIFLFGFKLEVVGCILVFFMLIFCVI